MKPLPSEWQTASVPQVAASFSIAPAKVSKWIGRGELTALNIADKSGQRPRYRIRRADWENFLATRTTATKPAASPRRCVRSTSPIRSFV